MKTLIANPIHLDAQMLSRMKSGSYPANFARGGIVDEHTQHNALTIGHLAGAALDGALEIIEQRS